MNPPKTVKFRNVIKLFKKYGITLEHGTKHPSLVSEDGRRYPLPNSKSNDDIERCYINAARRMFGLTEEDGITDKEFYSKP